MRVEVVVLGTPNPNSRYGLCNTELELNYRAQELRELSRGGRPGLPVPNSPCGLCGHNATLNSNPLAGIFLSPFLSLSVSLSQAVLPAQSQRRTGNRRKWTDCRGASRTAKWPLSKRAPETAEHQNKQLRAHPTRPANLGPAAWQSPNHQAETGLEEKGRGGKHNISSD